MSSTLPPNPASPCNGTCKLDNERICLGCGRHIDEIVAWPRLTAAEQTQVLVRSAQRRAVKSPSEVSQ